jgi:RNA polymerase sigma factor (sigma-70 family)
VTVTAAYDPFDASASEPPPAPACTAVPSAPPSPDLTPDELNARWAVVLPHAERLRRIAARRLASADEADDVVQEAMLRAVTFPQLNAEYAGQFLTSVTVRLCADVHRDRDRQLRVGVRDAVRAVPYTDPHEALLDDAEARWLYGECLKLPGRERAVMLARARGLSVREAAGTLGVGVKSAEAALTKARHRMRRLVHTAGTLVVILVGKARRAGTPMLVTTSMSVLVVGGAAVQATRPLRIARLHAHEAPLAALNTPDRGAPSLASVVRRPAVAATTTRAARATAPRTGTVTSHPGPIHTDPIGDPKVIGTKKGFDSHTQHENEGPVEAVQQCVQHLSLDPSKQLICGERE